MSRLPVVGGDNGAWATVLVDYLQVEHGSDGTHAISLPAAASFRYVAGTGISGVSGSDSNNGLSPGKAMSTLQAAYDALPATGGSVILLPGRHNVGSGFVAASAQKPCVFTSLTGYSPITRAPVIASTTFNAQPVIYGSGATLMKVSSGSGIANGWAWLGLSFDMSTTGNLYGIWAEDVNGGRVRDCMAEATHNEVAYLVRTTSPNFDDCSQWRIEDNYVRNVGLCTMNDGATDGNCNNNQVLNNCIFGGLGAGNFVVKIAVASRCLVMGNEVAISNGFVRYLGPSHYNHTLFNGGEGTTEPFVQYDSGAWGNVHFNYGTTGGAATGLEVNVNDLTAGDNYSYRRTQRSVSEKTANFTLLSVNQDADQIFEMNSASALTFTLPPQASVLWGVGKGGSIRQKGAGQVTVTPGAAVTINARNGLKTAGQNAFVNFVKVATDTWEVWGDTTVDGSSGNELGIIQRASSNFTTTQTVVASADTALTMASITFDGLTPCNFKFNGLVSNGTATCTTIFTLWEDSTDLGAICRHTAVTGTPSTMVQGVIRRTPTAGAKVYTIRGYVVGASTGTMYVAAATVPPAIFRIVRA